MSCLPISSRSHQESPSVLSNIWQHYNPLHSSPLPIRSPFLSIYNGSALQHLRSEGSWQVAWIRPRKPNTNLEEGCGEVHGAWRKRWAEAWQSRRSYHQVRQRVPYVQEGDTAHTGHSELAPKALSTSPISTPPTRRMSLACASKAKTIPRPAMSTRMALGPPKRVGSEIKQSFLIELFWWSRYSKYKKTFLGNGNGCLLAPRHFERDIALSLIPAFLLNFSLSFFPSNHLQTPGRLKVGDGGTSLNLDEEFAVGIGSACPVLSDDERCWSGIGDAPGRALFYSARDLDWHRLVQVPSCNPHRKRIRELGKMLLI